MNFDGHQMIKINRNWIFDCTTYIGYKVTTNKKASKLLSYEKAFSILVDKSNKLHYHKYIESIPAGVIRKTNLVVEAHQSGEMEKVIAK